jgi:hypothetical protein
MIDPGDAHDFHDHTCSSLRHGRRRKIANVDFLNLRGLFFVSRSKTCGRLGSNVQRLSFVAKRGICSLILRP